jgi:hypothetical protein
VPLHNNYCIIKISFTPFCCLQLLLAVDTKLEHVITQLAREVAEKHSAIEGDLVVNPSDEHFWLGRPKIVLYLIHFILFQNAFELSFFFWILVSATETLPKTGVELNKANCGVSRFLAARLPMVSTPASWTTFLLSYQGLSSGNTHSSSYALSTPLLNKACC